LRPSSCGRTRKLATGRSGGGILGCWAARCGSIRELPKPEPDSSDDDENSDDDDDETEGQVHIGAAEEESIAVAEVPTGQGKTLIATMIAVFLKIYLRHFEPQQRISIAILTTNPVLARQGYDAMLDIFCF
jgi:hypothetical protein